MQSPRLTLLGPVGLHGTTGTPPQSPALSLEIVAFMALYPSDSAHALDEALWPTTRVAGYSRRRMVLRARQWVGYRADGSPWVCLASEDGFRMADGFEVDWHDFEDLAPLGGLRSVPTSDLMAAMQLITGRPFSRIDPTRWSWAELLHQQVVEHVLAVTDELLSRDDLGTPRETLTVTSRALQVDASHEGIWCEHLTALMAQGNTHRLAGALGSARAYLDGLDLAPRTHELLEEAERHLRDNPPPALRL